MKTARWGQAYCPTLPKVLVLSAELSSIGRRFSVEPCDLGGWYLNAEEPTPGELHWLTDAIRTQATAEAPSEILRYHLRGVPLVAHPDAHGRPWRGHLLGLQGDTPGEMQGDIQGDIQGDMQGEPGDPTTRLPMIWPERDDV